MELKDKITTIRLKQETKDSLKKFKKYPCETDEEVLLRIIKIVLDNESR